MDSFYKEELDKLIDWIQSYTMASLTGPEVKKAYKALVRLSKRKLDKLDDREKLSYLYEVDAAIWILYNEHPGFKRMYRPDGHMETPELLEVTATTERLRFEDIRKIGYRPLYEKFDRSRFVSHFDRRTHLLEPITGFHIALEFVTTSVNDVDARDVPNEVLNLYIALRELEPFRPTLLTGRGRTSLLSFLYQTDDIGKACAPLYLTKLAEVGTALNRVKDVYGIRGDSLVSPAQGDIEVRELESLLEDYRQVIREVYSNLVFTRISRMV